MLEVYIFGAIAFYILVQFMTGHFASSVIVGASWPITLPLMIIFMVGITALGKRTGKQ